MKLKRIITVMICICMLLTTLTSCRFFDMLSVQDLAGDDSDMYDQPYSIEQNTEPPKELTNNEILSYIASVSKALSNITESGVSAEAVDDAKSLASELIRYSEDGSKMGHFMYTCGALLDEIVKYSYRTDTEGRFAQLVSEYNSARKALSSDEKKQMSITLYQFLNAAAACYQQGYKDYDVATLTFAGDVSFNTDYDIDKELRFDTIYENNGSIPESVLKNCAAFFATDDFTVVNNLTTYTDADTANTEHSPLYKASPDMLGALNYGNVDAVNLANLHTYDYLQLGYKDTLDNISITALVPLTESQPVKEDISGVPVTFLAYDITSLKANDKLITSITDQVTECKKDGSIVIVNFYWGLETNSPDKFQKKLAHAVIDAGADLIIGNGAEKMQGAELYNGKYIFYCLGELVNGTDYSLIEREAIMVSVKLGTGKDGYDVRSVSVIPYYENSNGEEDISDYTPTPQFSKAGDDIVKKFLKLSSKLDHGVTEIDYFNPTTTLK